MKVKHLALLVAVLGGISVVTLVVKQRGANEPARDPREGTPVIEATLLEKVTALHLHAPAGDVDLAKSDAGGKWTVRNYHDLPADFSKIATLITGLRDAKILQFASANPDRIAKMTFDGTSLELRDADGKALRTVHLGKDRESGGRFVKFDDEAKAYVASFSAFLDTTAKNWADTTLVAAKPEEVIALEVTFPEGAPLRLKRESGTAPWTAEELAEGEKLKDAEVTSLVSRLTSLRFTETAEANAEDVTAARANARTFKVTLATGKTYDVSLGRKPAPPAPPAAPAPAAETPPVEGAEPAAPPPPPPPPPAGPVYVFVTSSDANDPINGLMEHRGYQIYEWTYTSLPANRAALMEAAPPSAPGPAAAPENATPPPAEGAPSARSN